MKIIIFYSWQNKYKAYCDNIIQCALNAAIQKLNTTQSEFEYEVLRGGGNVLNSQEITDAIDKALRKDANLVVSDFTNIGENPNHNCIRRIIRKVFHNTMKFKACVNSNVTYETGKAEAHLGDKRQIIKVYNKVYGDYENGAEVPFDFRPEDRPIMFSCSKRNSESDKKDIINTLASKLITSIEKGTKIYLENQRAKFEPLVPITEELHKKQYQRPFYHTEQHQTIFNRISERQSFRLLGLPGTGKTRTICEAFKTKNANVCYCDCNNNDAHIIKKSIIELIKFTYNHRRKDYKQTIILDNCQSGLCTDICRIIGEQDFFCQLITIYYDVRETQNNELDYIILDLKNNQTVVQRIVDNIIHLDDNDKNKIKDLSYGFPLMAMKLCETYQKDKISVLRDETIYNRILNLDPKNSEEDLEKKKVLTAFAIFKYIGLEGDSAKMGNFIATNSIITSLNQGDAVGKIAYFHRIFNTYKNDVLEQSGQMGLMRLIPLAIYLSEQWYRQQDSETIRMLIKQIMDLPDEWIKNQLIDSLSQRITLLSDIPLAQELVNQLLNNNSPFFSEEVVLSKIGSRLFLGLSEVNPETCADKLFSIVSSKTDYEIKKIDDAKYNLSTALERLAFDKRSFKNAMLTLAILSTKEINWLSDNASGLFVDRFPIMLPATEASLTERLMVLKAIISKKQYYNLVKRALLMAININHNHRMGGAEKQGLKKLKDYVPKTYNEVLNYFYECFDMLLGLVESDADIDEICLSIAEYARGYYAYDFDDFLFKALDVLAPKKDFAWDDMKVALSDIIRYDATKRNNHKADLIREWLNKLTKDDYVSRLKNINHNVSQLDLSFDETMNVVDEECNKFAKEFIDNQLYKDVKLISAIMRSKCLYMNKYGEYLSIYAQEKGLQQLLLDNILSAFLDQETSNDGKTLFIHYIYKVANKEIVEQLYENLIKSDKKTILPALYAIKDEPEERLSQLFDMLDNKEIQLNDFNGYFLYVQQNQKYVLKRLLNYGDEAIAMIFIRYDSFLYNTEPDDNEYKIIARELLLKMGLQGVLMEDYTFCDCVRKYLERKSDGDIVLHIHNLTKEMLHSLRSNHYLLKLYWTVFHSNKNLLKPQLLLLLEDKEERDRWFESLRTCYTNDNPSYLELSYQEWFEWLNKGEKVEDKAYVLAEIFSYADGNDKANPHLVNLLDNYYSRSILSCICSRIESFSWIGSGIPTYRSRIAICNDYILQLKNEEAKQLFHKIIKSFEEYINAEVVNNANERVMYRERF